jgi:hypothetical protein
LPSLPPINTSAERLNADRAFSDRSHFIPQRELPSTPPPTPLSVNTSLLDSPVPFSNPTILQQPPFSGSPQSAPPEPFQPLVRISTYDKSLLPVLPSIPRSHSMPNANAAHSATNAFSSGGGLSSGQGVSASRTRKESSGSRKKSVTAGQQPGLSASDSTTTSRDRSSAGQSGAKEITNNNNNKSNNNT